MARKKELTLEEKNKIIQKLALGMSTLEISKELGRDHHTIKKITEFGIQPRKKRNQSEFKRLTARDLSRIKHQVVKTPNVSSKSIFDACGIKNIPRTTRCKVLKKFATVKKRVTGQLLTKKHKEARLTWAKKYVKTNFSNVIFTDESRVTLDGPDGWTRGWVQNGRQSLYRIRRQQGGGGVMIWAGIIGNEVIGPFKVEEGVKLNTVNYCAFLAKNFKPWLQMQNNYRRQKLIFMQDNAPSHASRYTKFWLKNECFNSDSLMDWPANSPDLNPIEHYWSILKAAIYRDGKQYSSKTELWKAIQTAACSVEPKVIENLTKSVDNRLIKILQLKGGRVN